MIIYIVMWAGIHMKLVAGVRSSLSQAKALAEDSIAKEKDHWHRIEILKIQIDQPSQGEVVDVLRRRMKYVSAGDGSKRNVMTDEVEVQWWESVSGVKGPVMEKP